MQELVLNDCPILIEGQGEHTIVMIHGWPDTLHVWQKQVDVLKANFRCVRFTLPGYSDTQQQTLFSLPDVLRHIENIIDHVSPHHPVTLLLHDWGCFFGYHYYNKHPERVARMISLDVGDAASKAFIKQIHPKEIALLLGYQLTLASLWLAPPKIGNFMTRRMAQLLGSPTPSIHIHQGMNYPYYLTWFKPSSGYLKPFKIKPSCPLLFIYGTQKPLMFHSKEWLQWIKQQPLSNVIALHAGHWMMIEKHNDFNQNMLAWLEQTQSVIQ